MRSLRLVAIALLLAATAGAQRPQTTIVTLAPRVADELAHAYDPQQEQVWRVTAFDSTARDGYTLITVLSVEHAGTGEPNKISPEDVARLGNDPIIHSHSPGNCQASPADKEAAVRRNAPFDGILCGDRYTTWYFAADIVAIENYRFLLSNRQD